MDWTKIITALLKSSIGGITQPLFLYGLLFTLVGVSVSLNLGTQNWLVICLIALGVLLIIAAVVMFCWLCIKNIDKLRSEEFEIEKNKK